MKKISNEILFEKIVSLTNIVDEKFLENEKAHSRILEQTTKTNGNVTNLNRWMQTSKGAIAVITTIVVPIMLYLLYTHIVK